MNRKLSWLLLSMLLACLGCPSVQEEEKVELVVIGDMVPKFEPPSLAELEKLEWIEQPVLDSMELLRAKKQAETPLATLEEALALKNQSLENNKAILSAMGRLPANEKDVDWEASINRHSAGDINSMFPLFLSSTVEFDIQNLTSFGLFGFDWTFRNFASKDSTVAWKKSKDGMLDMVVMRKDLTWSDGHPISAHDIVFSYQAIMTKAVPVKAVRQGTDQLKWVHAYDDHTVVFFHKESLATNDQNINFPIIPKHIFEHTIPKDPILKDLPEHIQQNNNPVVGGPYKLQKRTAGSEIILERRDDYYMHEGKQVRDKPYFKTIRFRIRPDEATSLLALKAGDIDEMILSPESWENQTNGDDYYKLNTKVYETEWTEFHFLWNCKDSRFSDKRVRWAMTYAFDHKELLQKQLYGMCEPCTGTFHPTSRWAPKPAPEPIQQDLTKAVQLLDEAGWKDTNGDGIRDKTINGKLVNFEFTLLTSNRADRVAICNLMKSSLDQIGVKCNVKAIEFAAMIDQLNKKEFQGAFGGWGAGTDPDTTENIYATGQNRNYGDYSDPAIDALFAAGKRELDPEKRVKIYQELALKLWDDQPYTWLYYRNAFYGFNKSLRGYMFSPRGPYHYGPGFSSIYKPLAP
jgi:peptide/nickel transport system substrate-binding protein